MRNDAINQANDLPCFSSEYLSTMVAVPTTIGTDAAMPCNKRHKSMELKSFA